ncbi:MAG TPA: sulfurtransferase TusA family protein [Tepiditoga sp.]|nr:sulfurtransferase TusA family protein [Tepiditoga sp.]
MKVFSTKVQSLDLPTVFKILSNQTRVEILIMLRDSCSTAKEISEKLSADISTVYRHLKFLQVNGLIKSYIYSGVERYDLSSEHVYNLIESGIMMLTDVKGTKSVEPGILKIFSEGIHELRDIKVDRFIDMRGELCPVPDISTRKNLESMQSGEVLLIIVDYPLSKERIPNIVKTEGHELIAIFEDNLRDTKIYIRRR